MPTLFGFSVGDVIAVSILIKDVFKALDDSTGAASEYQELCRELWALDRALLEVELLSRSCDTSVELNALSHTVRRVADQCRECIERFLEKIKRYERSLRDGGRGDGKLGRVCDVGRKIKWGLTQKGELARFRTEINAHSSAINMLLITANINFTKITGKNLDTRLEDAQQKQDDRDNRQLTILGTIQSKLDENGKQLDVQGTNTSRLMERLNYFIALSADLKSFMSKIWTLNFKMYNAVVELQSRIPKEFGPCWTQEPLVLTDALGRVAPIHLELINSWDVFDSVLAARFIDLPGERKIARGEYAIHEPNLGRDIQRTQPFAACFLPGHRLEMMMIFQDKDSILGTNYCPSCSWLSPEEGLNTSQCEKCGTFFQRIKELEESTGSQLDEIDRVDSGSKDTHDIAPSPRERHSRKRNASPTGFEEDDIRAFKRVRLYISLKEATEQENEFHKQVNEFRKKMGGYQKYLNDARKTHPFLCPLEGCNRKSVTMKDLQRHFHSVHISLHRYECEFFSRCFARRDTLRRHTVVCKTP